MSSARTRILQAGERLVVEKSFHGVGLAEILEAAGTTKGGFYHFFASKEQFGVELLRSGLQREILQTSKILQSPAFRAAEKFDLYWNSEIGRMSAAGCRHDSWVVKLGPEVANLCPEMRHVLRWGLEEIRRVYESTIREGQAEGEFRKDLSAANTAAWMQDYWNGALLRAGIDESVKPLQQAAEAFRAQLRQA